jgi:uncharacterized protein YukE
MLLADGGGGGLPAVLGGSFAVKTLPVDSGGASQYSADEIESFFASLEPSAVQEAGAAHAANAATLKDIAGAMITHAQRIQENWQGEGAEAALNTLKQMHATATALAEYSSQTGSVLTTLGGVLNDYVNFTVPVTLTSTEQQAVTHDPSALPSVMQAAQARQTAALQQKLTELNTQLAAANSALPTAITVNPPSKSGTKSTGGSGGVGVTGGVGQTGGGGAPTGGGGGQHSGSGGGQPTVGVPSPRPPTPTPPAPSPHKPTTVLSEFPPPGPVPGPGPVTGPVPPGPPVTTSPGGPPLGFPTPTPGVPTTTISGVPNDSNNVTEPGLGTPEDEIPPVTDPVLGPDVPGGPFPGGVPSNMMPTEDAFTPGSFSTPGLGNGVGEGLIGEDGAFGDGAVMGPDGMIGVPGFPSGSAAGGFDGDGASDGMIADGNPAAGGIAGADADGAGGYPMGGGVGSRRDESDRYRQSWMNEDEELWNGGVPVVPSHLGR